MKSFRNLLVWAHLVGGVMIGFLILILSLSGLLLVYERQIMSWLETPAVLEGQTSSGAPMPIETLLDQCLRNGQGLPVQLVLRNNPTAAIEAHFEHNSILFLNPWTGEIIGMPSDYAASFFGFVRNVHRSFAFRAGHDLTKFTTFTALFLLLSGILLWLPKNFTWATLRNRVRIVPGLTGQARHWNWHLAIGLWSLIPLFFIVATGLLIAYPGVSHVLTTVATQQATPDEQQLRDTNRRREHRHHSQRQFATLPANLHGVDHLYKAAQQQISDWHSITLQVPLPQDTSIEFAVDRSQGGQPEQISRLSFDPSNGQLVKINSFATMDASHRFRFLVRTIHTGEEFGLIGQTIAALSCIAAIFLVLTAYAMAWRRFREYRNGAKQSRQSR